MGNLCSFDTECHGLFARTQYEMGIFSSLLKANMLLALIKWLAVKGFYEIFLSLWINDV